MKHDARRLKRQQKQLDARFSRMRPVLDAFAIPSGGWIKTTRESLGMTAEQLGKRMGITKQGVATLERNEIRGTISLGSLERAARALGCRVSYAIVPETSLEAIVSERATLVAHRKLERVGHSVALEGQRPPAELDELQVAELVDDLRRKLGRDLWDSP